MLEIVEAVKQAIPDAASAPLVMFSSTCWLSFGTETVARMTEKRTVLFAPAKFANDLKGRFYNCLAKSLAFQFYT